MNGEQATVNGTEGFAWDLRNRMKSATVAGVSTAYAYDTSGVRVREKTGADDVYYLTTNINPAGYAQTSATRRPTRVTPGAATSSA